MKKTTPKRADVLREKTLRLVRIVHELDRLVDDEDLRSHKGDIRCASCAVCTAAGNLAVAYFDALADDGNAPA